MTNNNECIINILIESKQEQKNSNEICHLFHEIVFDFDISYNELFNIICDQEELKDYTLFFLDNNIFRTKDINSNQLFKMLVNTTWAETFILNNLEDILTKDYQNKIESLVKAAINNKDSFNKLLDKVGSLDNLVYIAIFADYIIKINSDILKTKNNSINSFLSLFFSNVRALQGEETQEKKLLKILVTCLETNLYYLAFFISNGILNDNYKNDLGKVLLKYSNYVPVINYMDGNFDKILISSRDCKVQLIAVFQKCFDNKLCDKYILYSGINNLIKNNPYDIDENQLNKMLSIMIDNDMLDYVNDLIKEYISKSKSNDISFIKQGRSCVLYKVGDYALKIATKRFVTYPDEHFRVILNYERKIIYDEIGQPLLFIEMQEYLNQDPEKLTQEEIYEVFIDLRKAGLETTDPKTLTYDYDNFGVLSDYTKANIKGYNSPEDLPEHFKKNPIVILDNDLIYKKDSSHAKHFSTFVSRKSGYTMDDAIADYEENKLYKESVKKLHM